MANSDNKIQIGGDWKDMSEVYINVGDTWKTVTEAYINVGDSWQQWWGGTWVEKFGLDFWVCLSNCSWDGDSYNAVGTGLVITPTGTWAEGYRPTKIRITATTNQVGGWTTELRDTGMATIATVLIPQGSNQTGEGDITWGAVDMLRIQDMDAPSVGQIENIEFLE